MGNRAGETPLRHFSAKHLLNVDAAETAGEPGGSAPSW
jgi:hypothetical protein